MTAVTLSHLIIILFDLNMRESFEEIITWTNFIRRTCNYEYKIILFGSYNDASNLLTEASDIEDIKKTSGQISEYFEIGKLANNDLITLIDRLIFESYEEVEAKARNEPVDRYSGIGKSLDCYII